MPEIQTPSRLHFSLPLDPARLLRARHRIRDYLHDNEVQPLLIDDMVLAIQEAMTNAVRHSGARDELKVTLFFDGMDLVVLVKDHGDGFDVATFRQRSAFRHRRHLPRGHGPPRLRRLLQLCDGRQR